MSGEIVVERAAFYKVSANGANGDRVLDVHFNPASLIYTITNTLQQQGNTRRQYVSQSTAKLTMDLIFDTTDDGTDVRTHTTKIARLMEPGAERQDGQRDVPEVVAFDWGTFRFRGMVETYRETIDFFAPEGVPLRATVSLGLTRQDHIFEADPNAGTGRHTADEQAIVETGAGQDVNDIATQGGNPGGWLAIAVANGVENPRHLGVGALAIGGSARFSASASLGTGASVGVSASASFGASANGSAGMAASAGAFAGLRAPSRGPALPVRVDASLIQQRSESAAIATAGASFGLGGEAVGGSGSLSADVGASASLRAVISFDE